MFLGGSHVVLKRMILTLKIDIATLWAGLNPESVPQMGGINKLTLFKDV